MWYKPDTKSFRNWETGPIYPMKARKTWVPYTFIIKQKKLKGNIYHWRLCLLFSCYSCLSRSLWVTIGFRCPFLYCFNYLVSELNLCYQPPKKIGTNKKKKGKENEKPCQNPFSSLCWGLAGHLYSSHTYSLSPLSLAGVPAMPLCRRGSTLNTEMGDASHLKWVSCCHY